MKEVLCIGMREGVVCLCEGGYHVFVCLLWPPFFVNWLGWKNKASCYNDCLKIHCPFVRVSILTFASSITRCFVGVNEESLFLFCFPLAVCLHFWLHFSNKSETLSCLFQCLWRGKCNGVGKQKEKPNGKNWKLIALGWKGSPINFLPHESKWQWKITRLSEMIRLLLVR